MVAGLDSVSVLVIRSLGGIGDVLMTTPAIRALKEQHTSISITYACERYPFGIEDIYSNLIYNAPFIDYVVNAKLVDHRKYDLVIDLTSVCIPYEQKGFLTRNRIDIFADAMGVQLVDKLPFYRVEDHELVLARRFQVPGKQLVFLHTASADDKRSWPIERYKELISSCRDLPIHFLVSDFNQKAADWSRYDNVTEVSRLSVRAKAAAIQRCDLFIGPDSGPMHLAGALKRPAIVLFGSTPPQARINHYPTHTAITTKWLPCLGCWYDDCAYNVKCMSLISVDQVKSLMLERLCISSCL